MWVLQVTNKLGKALKAEVITCQGQVSQYSQSMECIKLNQEIEIKDSGLESLKCLKSIRHLGDYRKVSARKMTAGFWMLVLWR